MILQVDRQAQVERRKSRSPDVEMMDGHDLARKKPRTEACYRASLTPAASIRPGPGLALASRTLRVRNLVRAELS